MRPSNGRAEVVVYVVASLRNYVDSLLHPSARRDALTAARHRAFIGSRLVASAVILATLPIYILLEGVPGPLQAIFFAWFIMPLANAYFLSRTGYYEAAHILGALSLVCLVTIVSLPTGGIASFAAIWLVVAPVEAGLASSRRAVTAASGFAIAAAVVLIAFGSSVEPTDQSHILLEAVGILSAALYGAALGLRAEMLARATSKQLSVEEARYDLLARNMSDVIARHGRNGAVLFVSPAAEVMFGAPAAGLMNNGLFERVHVADRPAYLTVLAHAAGGEENRSVEFRVRRDAVDEHGAPTSQFIWIDMRCRSLDRIVEGPVASESREVVAVMREVTKRKVQEQALEDARIEAERANAAKGRFLATMSHELRTPLNAVIGFSEMLMHDQDMQLDAAQRRDYAHLIYDFGHHLLSVVNGILDMSKIETGNFEITPEPFAPAPVIRSCCDLLTLKARDAGVELLPRIATDMPEIVADKRALKQIMLNLISNAIKFTDRGGHVVVEAAVDSAIIVMRVVDNGVGISEDDLPRLGDPFFQARGSYARPYDGTGLGLSIVKGLIALHQGRLEIQSRVAEGTCVTVRLPIDCETAVDVPGNVTSLPVSHNAAPAVHKEEARLRA